jgi:hypothetical protein
MDQPVKLLLDECLGHPLAEDIKKMLSWDTPPPTISHLFEFFKSGETDDVWIPKIASEGWVILTADRGKKGKVKLPGICLQHKRGRTVLANQCLHPRRQWFSSPPKRRRGPR